MTKENLSEYLDLVVEKRLIEFDMQMKAIKEGITLIMPEHILFFMTWEEVDIRATGKKTIDVDILKKITIYEVRRKEGAQGRLQILYLKFFIYLSHFSIQLYTCLLTQRLQRYYIINIGLQ